MNTYRARAPPRQPLAAPFPPPWERTQRRIYNIMSYNVLLDYSILHDIAQYHMILVKLNLFMCTCVYLHIYIYIYTHIYTHISLSLYIYIYIYIYISAATAINTVRRRSSGQRITRQNSRK